MTIALPWRRRLSQAMSDKPKSPWGSGGGGDSDGAGGGDADGSAGNDAGPRNPWAQPPGSRPRPARPGNGLEDLLRRARGGGGGGGFGGFNLPGGSGRSFWGWGVGLLVAAWVLLTSIHVIGPQEQGVVTFFGKYSGTLDTGWSVTLPAPINSVDKINVTGIRSFAFPDGGGANLVLTRDGNLVDLSYTVQWNVSDPQKYRFELDRPDDAVKATAESAVRAAIANSTLDDVLGAGKIEIQTRVRDSMQKVLDDYQSGIRIVSVALNNASAPQQVMDAFKDVTAAQNDRQSNITQARGYAIQVLANAQSQAASFNGAYAQYKLAPDVTRRRIYYETMEQILNRVDKTIVEPRNLAPLLPLPGGKTAPNVPATAGDR
jgi:membrane protease subunit HflK